MFSLRENARQFLDEAAWSDASLLPLAGDMSTRRYFRLKRFGGSAILMDADKSMQPFCDMTHWLADIGLSAPDIIAARAEQGLLLLEDFGDQSVKSAVASDPSLKVELYEESISLLLRIRESSRPELVCPSPDELVEWTRLTDKHYPGALQDGLEEFRGVLNNALVCLKAEPATVSLRDFHSENMMWLRHRSGLQRLGLLDYQDAILTHPAYDLVSLLTDARTWVSRATRKRVVDRYLERSDDDREAFLLAFSALSAQRNLRILGIFSRANRHLACIPNTYRYFVDALEHPVFDAVRALTLESLPPPGSRA